MQIFRPSDSEREKLKAVMARLRAGRLQESQGQKEVEAAKLALSCWLKTERNVDIETLPIGHFVCIEDVGVIEIGKRSKFDEKAFLMAHPALHAEFKKDFPIQFYK